MDRGKPQKQSLAIAYSMKRKKKASGGTVESGDPQMNYSKGGMPKPMSKGGNPYSEMEDSKRKNMAAGGFIGSHQPAAHASCNNPAHAHLDEQAPGYAPLTDPMSEPTEQGLTESGQQSDAHDMDMIGRIMHKRKMSQGGKVANDTEEGVAADELPNEFDDLVLRDGLEFKDTGANSGDEISHDEDYKNDPVSRAMMKRKAKKRD